MNAILIVAMVSNLMASVFVIAVQLQNNAERRAASQLASKERKLLICILQVPVEERSNQAVEECRNLTVNK